MDYLQIKYLHIVLVISSLSLFNARFFFLLIFPTKVIPSIWKRIPSIVDTVLLISGIVMAKIAYFVPFTTAPWLGVKLCLLVLYILCGIYALRCKPRSFTSIYAYLLGMTCVSLMVYLAHFKPEL